MAKPSRTRRCDQQVRDGRLAKARQFWEAAEVLDEEADLIDAHITLCVHAGIAAADVICCDRLGEHAQGESPTEAVALLERADKPLAQHLRVLLGMKTRAGYSDVPLGAANRRKAERAARALVAAAESSR